MGERVYNPKRDAGLLVEPDGSERSLIRTLDPPVLVVGSLQAVDASPDTAEAGCCNLGPKIVFGIGLLIFLKQLPHAVGYDAISEGEGMLFVWDEPADRVFEIKDVEYALDVIFIAEDGALQVVDFGIMGRLDRKTRNYLADMLLARGAGDILERLNENADG